MITLRTRAVTFILVALATQIVHAQYYSPTTQYPPGAQDQGGLAALLNRFQSSDVSENNQNQNLPPIVSASMVRQEQNAPAQQPSVPQAAEPAPMPQAVPADASSGQCCGMGCGGRLCGMLHCRRKHQDPPCCPIEPVAAPVVTEAACDTGACCEKPFCGPVRNCCNLGLEVGVEGVFLAPIGEPEQSVYLTDLGSNSSVFGESTPGLGAGIRTWIELQKNDRGLRARYLYFGNAVALSDPEFVVPADPGFIQSYNLDANTLDLELTQQFCLCEHQLETSFGGRWARLNRSSTVTGFGTVGGTDVQGFAYGANETEGAGFTSSIGGRRAIFCDGGWNFIWGFRGSFIWADSTTAVLTDVTAAQGATVARSRDSAFAGTEAEDLFILDLTLGVEYESCIKCCCREANLFFRTGFEYQWWDTGSPFAESYSFAGVGGPGGSGLVEAFSYGHDGDLSLIGFFLGGGIRF
jgi:hypothetical protein